MGGIFVSYRRGDAEGQARALFNELSDLIGKHSVFMDVDSIALGRDFRQILQERLDSCDLMLALIGPDWLDIRDASGNRRLDTSADFVRQEIAAALKRNIPVTPVLVRGAQMPAPDRLPDDLKDLVYRNGFELSHTRWDSDVGEMIKRLGLGQTDVQKSQPETKLAPEARHTVVRSSPVAATRSLTSTNIAISAGVTLLLLVSLVAWLMSGGDSGSAGTSTTEPLSEKRTSVAGSPESPRPEVHLVSRITKSGGIRGTQRSPPIDHQETFETTGVLRMEVELSRGACSKVRFHVFIDGVLVKQTEFTDDTTGVLELGPVPSGRHTLKLSPEGQFGKCNSGTLESWGGTLRLHVSS